MQLSSAFSYSLHPGSECSTWLPVLKHFQLIFLSRRWKPSFLPFQNYRQNYNLRALIFMFLDGRSDKTLCPDRYQVILEFNLLLSLS
jgi:hypothetical protein